MHAVPYFKKLWNWNYKRILVKRTHKASAIAIFASSTRCVFNIFFCVCCFVSFSYITQKFIKCFENVMMIIVMVIPERIIMYYIFISFYKLHTQNQYHIVQMMYGKWNEMSTHNEAMVYYSPQTMQYNNFVI